MALYNAHQFCLPQKQLGCEASERKSLCVPSCDVDRTANVQLASRAMGPRPLPFDMNKGISKFRFPSSRDVQGIIRT